MCSSWFSGYKLYLAVFTLVILKRKWWWLFQTDMISVLCVYILEVGGRIYSIILGSGFSFPWSLGFSKTYFYNCKEGLERMKKVPGEFLETRLNKGHTTSDRGHRPILKAFVVPIQIGNVAWRTQELILHPTYTFSSAERHVAVVGRALGATVLYTQSGCRVVAIFKALQMLLEWCQVGMGWTSALCNL